MVSYSQTGQESLEAIAQALADLVDARPGITAASQGEGIVITQLGTTAETITDNTDSPAAINTVNSSEYKTRKITFNDNGEETPAAGNWNISIGGANYNYLVGNNNETETFETVDATIFDDEAPQIILEETNGDTRVVELTEDLPLGGGRVTGINPDFNLYFDQDSYVEGTVTTDTGGNGRIDIIPLGDLDTEISLRYATVVLSGDPEVGEKWELSIEDDSVTPNKNSHTVVEGDTLQDIATSYGTRSGLASPSNLNTTYLSTLRRI